MYIPVLDVPNIWVDMAHNGGSVKYIDGFFTVNGIMPDDSYVPDDLRGMFGPLPDKESLGRTQVRELIRAWDPVAGKTVWEHETSTGLRGYDGGVMSTAGNLVFQGRGSGELWVYAADTGKVLKIIQTGSHIMAAPMTYTVNAKQYRRGAGWLWRRRDHRGRHPSQQRGYEISERQSNHCIQAGRSCGSNSALRTPSRRSETSAADRRQGQHSGRRNPVCAGVLALPRAGTQRDARICAIWLQACMPRSRTSSCAAQWPRQEWSHSAIC